MIVKNIGNELICIGEIQLMPGGEKIVANSTAQNPLVKVLADHGELLVTEESTVKAKATAVKKAAAPAEDTGASEPDTAEEKTSTKGRKSKKSAAKAE